MSDDLDLMVGVMSLGRSVHMINQGSSQKTCFEQDMCRGGFSPSAGADLLGIVSPRNENL